MKMLDTHLIDTMLHPLNKYHESLCNIRKLLLRIVMCSVLICTSIGMSAQVNEQRIFLWDVSHSLISNGLEQHLKQALIASIEAIEENGSDRIVLVPFYNGPLQVIEVEATAQGKRALINEINSRNIKGSPVSNTNIVAAISKFQELIKPEYRNYMFLYTDGKNENERQQTDMESLVSLLRQWGIKTKDKNAYGFYVLVHSAADFKELHDIERENDNFFVVKDANVRIKILNLPQSSIFNSKNEEVLKMPVSGDLKHIGNNIAIECQDTIYSVAYKGLKIENDGKSGILELEIAQRTQSPLPESHIIAFRPVIAGADAYTFITPKNPVIRAKYKKERAVDLRHSESGNSVKADLGECTYYPAFLWSDENKGNVVATMDMEFNKDSKDHQSRGILLLTDMDRKPLDLEEYEILLNGNPILAPEIPIEAAQQQFQLTIRPLPTTSGGAKAGYLMLMPGHTLDRVNQTEVEGSTSPVELMQWRLKYHNNMNPVAKWLLISGIIVLALLLLWLIILRPMVYPRIRKASRVAIIEPYYANRKVKGAYKFVCTSRARKQGLASQLFTGKVIYEVNPVWTSDLVFTASKRGLRLSPNAKYEMEPYASTLVRNSEYQLKNTDNKEKITISIQ